MVAFPAIVDCGVTFLALSCGLLRSLTMKHRQGILLAAFVCVRETFAINHVTNFNGAQPVHPCSSESLILARALVYFVY